MRTNLEQVIFQMQLKRKIRLCRKRSAVADKKAAAKQQAMVLFNVQQVIRRKRQRSSKEPWFQPFAIKPSVEQPRLASPTPITGRMDDDCEIVGASPAACAIVNARPAHDSEVALGVDSSSESEDGWTQCSILDVYTERLMKHTDNTGIARVYKECIYVETMTVHGQPEFATAVEIPESLGEEFIAVFPDGEKAPDRWHDLFGRAVATRTRACESRRRS